MNAPITASGVVIPGRQLLKLPRQKYSPVVAGAVTALVVITLLIIGVLQLVKYTDPYRDWPPAGTQTSTNEEPLYANAIVVMTCQDGKAHLEEKMLVKPKRAGTLPSWYIKFYVAYDQSRADFCEVNWKAYPTNRVRFTSLSHSNEHYKEFKGWAQTAGGASFDGLESLKAKKSTSDITVLLLNLTDQAQGPEIKNGPNGIPAPARELLEGSTP